MEDAMVTGRMSTEKKAAGAKVLGKAGLNASQAVNLLYDRLEEEQNVDFLVHRAPEQREWESAAKFLDALAAPENAPFIFASRALGEKNSPTETLSREFKTLWKNLRALNDPNCIYARLPWDFTTETR
jgi:antitoxin component of RelBE/YafQ-DinJ toxin-antitoxin module